MCPRLPRRVGLILWIPEGCADTIPQKTLHLNLFLISPIISSIRRTDTLFPISCSSFGSIKTVSVPCISIRLILKSHRFVPAISSEIRFYPVRASPGLQQGIGHALRIVPDAPDSENEMDTDDLDGTFHNDTSDGMSTVIPGHRSGYRPSTSSLSRNR